jgi:hypothetical protein
MEKSASMINVEGVGMGINKVRREVLNDSFTLYKSQKQGL